ncbi:helix-turn-helix domain-containing protein [Lacticaseibacillus absianus]|uniref:helix-turn-helix domain-containing protein n=1 Tax=Lacticaseibacillus absianus TaxID=2729623 RepID=UPI0015C88A3F|nr:helix-turn-helix transcriptional regulator [Lacticaseibacillus absianus]
MALVERIKKVAKEKYGWNLKETATHAGIGINSIYRWKDQTPTADSLKAVAKALNVTTDYLLGNTDDPNPAKSDPSAPVDLADDVPMTFEGRPIDSATIEIFRAILRNQGGDDK